MPTDPQDKNYFSTSLEKGLKILSLFNAERPSYTQTEISRATGINMTSTYRFVNTLVHLGYLEKDARTKELGLGLRSLVLSTNTTCTTDALRLIKTAVDRMHERYNISIDVVLAIDAEMFRIYHREAKDAFTYSLRDIARNALHNTSVGKAYLSTLSTDTFTRVLDGMTMIAKTANTIVAKEQLFTEIEQTRRRGYAMCIEEYTPGLITIGAPLHNRQTGKGLGAVSFDFSIIEHSARTVERRYAALVDELGRELSEILQHQR
jgi:DNA-binding IclR family transcriptional regulator